MTKKSIPCQETVKTALFWAAVTLHHPTSENKFSHTYDVRVECQFVLKLWGHQLDCDIGHTKLISSLGYYGPVCIKHILKGKKKLMKKHMLWSQLFV